MSENSLPCVVLAGGLGTRLRESTEFKPKPMVEIGNKPILWHILKSYSYYKINNFIICTGYKYEIINSYFQHYKENNYDFLVNTNSNEKQYFSKEFENWQVLLSYTGEKTNTGGRIYKVRDYINSDLFLCTYGDGISDININNLIDFHIKHGKSATVTVVQQPSRFGVVETNNLNQVTNFKEKPLLDGLISAGYFVFNRKVLNYLDEDSVLEKEPLSRLATEGQLMAFHHKGFWQSMDTYREQLLLNDLIESGNAPWIKW